MSIQRFIVCLTFPALLYIPYLVLYIRIYFLRTYRTNWYHSNVLPYRLAGTHVELRQFIRLPEPPEPSNVVVVEMDY